MRTSLRRWLLHRREPKLQSLVLRTTWGDFAYRMHRAIEIDMAIELGEVTVLEWMRKQRTQPLPAIDHSAPTERAPSPYWDWDDTRHTWTMPTEKVEV